MRHIPSGSISSSPSKARPFHVAAAIATVLAAGCVVRPIDENFGPFPASFRKGDIYEFPGYKVRLADFPGVNLLEKERLAGPHLRLLGAAAAVQLGHGRWIRLPADTHPGQIATSPQIEFESYAFEGGRLCLDGGVPEELKNQQNNYAWKSGEDVAATLTAVFKVVDANGDTVLEPGEILQYVRATFPGAAK